MTITNPIEPDWCFQSDEQREAADRDCYLDEEHEADNYNERD